MADRITVSGDLLVEEDDSTGDVTIHVDQGTVSQAATEPNEIPRFDQLGGGGMWEEDANSPVSETSVSSVTYTMDTAYDRVYVEYENVGGGQVDLQVNGDTAGNYRFVTADGTNTSGANQVSQISFTSSGEGGNGAVLIGEYQSGIKATPLDRSGGGDIPTGSDNTNVSHPLTQFTLLFSQTADVTVRAFGRDV